MKRKSATFTTLQALVAWRRDRSLIGLPSRAAAQRQSAPPRPRGRHRGTGAAARRCRAPRATEDTVAVNVTRSRSRRASTASHARHGLQLQADQPELVRHDAPHQAAVVREPVRQGRQHVRRRASDAPRRRASTPTAVGELKTTFEFELFGTGVDEGQTTFRLRHAYGELGAFGAGQTWSPFMDIDVFPNSLEYWGPTGMVFFRNVQVRWMPIKGDRSLTIALERPGASGDQGVYADRIELQNIKGRFPLPDLSGEYTLRRQVGLRPGRRHAARDQVGRRARRPVRSVGQRHRLGRQPELQPQVRRQEATSSACSSCSARASRTT